MTAHLKELRKKYPYIVAWGRHHGQPLHKIHAQILKAEREQAPPNSIYYDGGWAVLEQIQSEHLREWILQQGNILRELK